MWKDLDAMLMHLERPSFTKDQMMELKRNIASFTKNMVDAWGETHVTHYMHALYAHIPWFLEKHGSLAIWSIEGMERSHYLVKAIIMMGSHHGG